MNERRRIGLILGTATLLLGCGGPATIVCVTNDDCIQGHIPGTCLSSPASTKHWCAFSDSTCAATQLRWGVASGDDLAGTCVQDGQSTDGGVPDGSPGPDASPPPTNEFAMSFPGFRDDRPTDMAATADGGVLIVGEFRDTFNAGNTTLVSRGQTDLFVVKVDAYRHVQWLKQFGGVVAETNPHVAVFANGDIAIVASTSGTMDFGGALLGAGNTASVVLARLNSNGGHIWSTAASGNEYVGRVAVDSQGALYAAITFEGAKTVGALSLTSRGMSDGALVRFDGTSGAAVWATQIGGAQADAAYDLVARDGQIWMSGTFQGVANLGSGGVTSHGGTDGFVGHYRATDGALLGITQVGGHDPTDRASVSKLTLTEAGDVVMCIEYEGNLAEQGESDWTSQGQGDFAVRQLNAAGSTRWTRAFGASGDERCSALSVGAEGVVAAGTFNFNTNLGQADIPSKGGTDLWMVQFSDIGDPRQTFTFGGTGDDAVAQLLPGTVTLLTGSFAGSIDLGVGTPLMSVGEGDVFLLGRRLL